MAREKRDITDEEILELKMEIAAELGLLEKIQRYGWEALTAAEAGRIGGLLARYLREQPLEAVEFPQGKIGSGTMATCAGQPAIKYLAGKEEKDE